MNYNVKDLQLFLEHFNIRHLPDLIGKKFLINYIHEQYDEELMENEICFQILSYHYSSSNLSFTVPTIGLEGNCARKKCTLTFFPSNDSKQVLYGIHFKSDHIKDNIGKGKSIGYEVRKAPDKRLKIQLL